MRRKLLSAWVIALMTTAATARAQFTQYSPLRGTAAGEGSTKNRLEKAMEQARWNLGPLRLEPWVGIGNLRYYDDLEPWREGKQSDVTFSAGAGVTAFLPIGRRLLLASYILPEYSWWREYTGRNRERGRYGVGLFAELGRLSFDLKGFRATEAWYIGLEEEVPLDAQRAGLAVNAELRLLGRLFAYGTAEGTQWRHRDKDLRGAPVLRLRTLDRDERSGSGGLRYRLGDRLTFNLGYSWSETDFLLPDFDRSNEGNAPTVGFEYSGNRISLSAQVSDYDLKPSAGSAFLPFDGRTGRARAEWKLGARSSLEGYAHKSLAYAFGRNSYFERATTGLALRIPLGWRGAASAFAETTTRRSLGAGREERDERVYGIATTLALRGRTSLSVRWDRRNYDSFEKEGTERRDALFASLNFGFGSAVTW